MRGQITEFHVVIDSHRMLIPPYSNYYKDDLDCDSTYEAQIYAVNKVGLSVTPSRMIIPKKSDGKYLVTFKLHFRHIILSYSMTFLLP